MVIMCPICATAFAGSAAISASRRAGWKKQVYINPRGLDSVRVVDRPSPGEQPVEASENCLGSMQLNCVTSIVTRNGVDWR
jgi:hypothetical protein